MRALYLAAFCFAVAGCGESGVTQKTSPEDAGVSDASPAIDAGPRVRTVENRNPFGDTAEHNLMVDGDFELTSGQGQYGWVSYDGTGMQATLLRETGGLCLSGVTCGILTSDADLLGYGAAPRDKDIEVSVYTKPPIADCGLTQVLLIGCAGGAITNLASVPPTTSEPDASGWCFHHAIAPPQELRPCLYVSSGAESGVPTLVDKASMLAADGSGSGSSSLASGPPSADTYSRVSRTLRAVHEHIPIGRGVPSLTP